MTTFRRTPGLDRLLSEAREIGGTYLVVWELSQESVNKAVWLRNAGRDFFSVTASMQGAVARAQVEAYRRGGLPNVIVQAPEAIRAHVLRRFDEQGFDVPLRPLTPAYVVFKYHHDLDPRIGIAKRDLRNEVERARVYLRKTG